MLDLQAQASKAIRNENLDFFDHHSHKFSFQQKRALFSQAITQGRFNLIKKLITLNYVLRSNRVNLEPRVLTNFVEKFDRPDILALFEKHSLNLDFNSSCLLVISTEKGNYESTEFLLARIKTNDFPATITALEKLLSSIRRTNDINDFFPLILQFKEKLNPNTFTLILENSFNQKKDLLTFFQYHLMEQSIENKSQTSIKKVKI